MGTALIFIYFLLGTYWVLFIYVLGTKKPLILTLAALMFK